MVRTETCTIGQCLQYVDGLSCKFEGTAKRTKIVVCGGMVGLFGANNAEAPPTKIEIEITMRTRKKRLLKLMVMVLLRERQGSNKKLDR